VEHLLAPLFNHFILAEKCYEQELSFIGSKYSVIENKFRPPFANWQAPPPRFPSKGDIRLLYSGTIAEHYGIWEAIEIAEQLHAIDKGVSLTIIGYCAKPELLEQILVKIKSLPYISIIGGDKLVSHNEILKEISKANVGLLTYQNNLSTANKIPTKYYEYGSYNLVSICTNEIMSVLFSNKKLVVSFYNTDFSKLYIMLILVKNSQITKHNNFIYRDNDLLKTIQSI
jgi:glycosyltransferase involved in cell wall biosynthesis